jgi:predicted metal-dependent hydrolase
MALAQSALLFDGGLYFEVHELLEPYWLRAASREREILQGLIQVAVGFHHLCNGNGAGARALLHDGAAKLLGRQIGGIDVDAFARAVVSTLDNLIRLGVEAPARFKWSSVPRFPSGPA